jgi:hypothetical protein
VLREALQGRGRLRRAWGGRELLHMLAAGEWLSVARMADHVALDDAPDVFGAATQAAAGIS